jgi:hypothetical protein
MPTYENLHTIAGRVECLLTCVEEGWPFDIRLAISDLNSDQDWLRANAQAMISANLGAFWSLARALVQGHLNAVQIERFRAAVASQSEVLDTLKARGFEKVDLIRAALS